MLQIYGTQKFWVHCMLMYFSKTMRLHMRVKIQRVYWNKHLEHLAQIWDIQRFLFPDWELSIVYLVAE